MARKVWRLNLVLDAELEPIVRQAAGARNMTVTAYINQVLLEHAPADMEEGYQKSYEALRRIQQRMETEHPELQEQQAQPGE